MKPKKRHWWVVALGLALVGLAVTVCFLPEIKGRSALAPFRAEVGGLMPEFALHDLNGRLVDVADYKGTPVIVNFWASWCDPCVAEFPSLMKVIARKKGQVILLAISEDSSVKDIQKFLKSFNVKDDSGVLFLWDRNRSVSALFGTSGIPETFLFDANHRLQKKVVGAIKWDDY